MLRLSTYLAFVLAAVLTLGPASAAQAQSTPPKGTVGLAGSVQGSQTILSVPIWVTPTVTVAPNLGFVIRENGTDTLVLGADAHFYTRNARVAPYLGPRLLFLVSDPDNENADTVTDVLIGGLGGAEFFLANQFSLSVEGQLDLRFNDSRSNVFSTGTAVRATVYF